ncbi:retroviral aspartyl protease, partial [Opisthorchis viverrini]
MRTRSHGKTEEPVASGGSFWSLCYRTLQSFFSLLSSVISAGFIHTRSPPKLFHPQISSARVTIFAAGLRAHQNKSSSRDIVRDEHILKDGVTEDVFERLRARLTERTHPVEHQYRFQSRIQLSGERLSNFIIVGTQAPKLRERFLGSPLHSVAEALQVANQVEDILSVLQRDREPNTAHLAPVHIQQQSRRWTPTRGRPYHPMPLRPNRPYFHSTFQRPAPTNLSRWPIPSRDCPYCQRFGRRARTFGHNGPREFTQFRFVPICTFDFLSTHRTPPTVDGHVWDRGCRILIDTGAACCLINSKSLPLGEGSFRHCPFKLMAVNGGPVHSTGWSTVPLTLHQTTIHQPMLVVDSLPWDVILGVDFLKSQRAKIDLLAGTIELEGNQIPIITSADCADECCPAMSIDIDVLLSRLSPTMSLSTTAELGSVLSEYIDVFAWKNSDVGRTKHVQHRIDTTPVRLPPRCVPI